MLYSPCGTELSSHLFEEVVMQLDLRSLHRLYAATKSPTTLRVLRTHHHTIEGIKPFCGKWHYDFPYDPEENHDLEIALQSLTECPAKRVPVQDFNPGALMREVIHSASLMLLLQVWTNKALGCEWALDQQAQDQFTLLIHSLAAMPGASVRIYTRTHTGYASSISVSDQGGV